MPLLPRIPFAMLTPLGPGEAGERLSAAIAAPLSSNAYHEPRPFSGRFSGASFDVMRTSRGRNSFRPRIRGTIESATGGSRIHGTMQLHEMVVVFVGFIVLGPMWLFVQLILQSMETGQWDFRIFALPAAALGLLAIMGFAFAFESRRAVRELTALLDGEVTSARSQ
jgi:hypothetical protein